MRRRPVLYFDPPEPPNRHDERGERSTLRAVVLADSCVEIWKRLSMNCVVRATEKRDDWQVRATANRARDR